MERHLTKSGYFVARKYLPADVDLKGAVKVAKLGHDSLTQFWYARQETGEGPTFLFKAWKNRDGDMVASVVIWQVTFSSDSESQKADDSKAFGSRRPEPRVTLITWRIMLMMTQPMVDPTKETPEERQVLRQHVK